MISRPLFKQSCKANAGVWSFVALITCAMLAIIIIVLGNLNVDEIRSSMTDMFIKDALESQIEENSMTFYDMTDTALSSYESGYNQLNNLLNVQLNDTVKTQIIAGYNGYKGMGMGDEEARQALTSGQPAEYALGINTLIDYYLVQGEDYSAPKISQYVLNNLAEAMYDKLLEEEGKETADTAMEFIRAAISAYVASGADSVTEFATSYIPMVLQSVFHEQSFEYDGQTYYVSYYFSKEKINSLSYSSIVSYRAELEVKEKQLRANNPEMSDGQIAEELEKIKGEIIADKSAMLIDNFPEKVSKALTELGNMNVYELVIGSMFFRMAGLLLPMIFVIMASNNLIAGQVDSGSMAYVLSTPTKRRSVTVTQMCYMVLSLFVMYSLTSITGVVCLALVGTDGLTISYGQLLLLNLGAFVTMIAVSGICFLASCWFNRSRLSMACGGGLTMFFLVATILGLFGSNVIPSAIRIGAMKYFNYVSLITLFDVNSILAGTAEYLWKLAILLAVGIVTYFIGIFKFDKKDLPL